MVICGIRQFLNFYTICILAISGGLCLSMQTGRRSRTFSESISELDVLRSDISKANEKIFVIKRHDPQRTKKFLNIDGIIEKNKPVVSLPPNSASASKKAINNEPLTLGSSNSVDNRYSTSKQTVLNRVVDVGNTDDVILEKRFRSSLLVQVSRFLEETDLTLVISEDVKEGCRSFGKHLLMNNIWVNCLNSTSLEGYHPAIVFIASEKDEGNLISEEFQSFILYGKLDFAHLVFILLSSKTVLQPSHARLRYCIVQPKVDGIEFREVFTFGPGSSIPVDEVVARWNPLDTSEPLIPSRADLIVPMDFKGNKIRVAYYEYSPEVFLASNSSKIIGYSVDIIKMLSKRLNFKIQWIRMKDQQSGIPLENGSYSGLVGFLMKKKADLGIPGLNMYAERSRVIDFTTSMGYGAAQLMIFRGSTQEATLWSIYFGGFPVLAWVSLICVWLIMSYGLGVTAGSEPEVNLYNNLFIFIGVICQQGSPIVPENIKGRIVFVSFWFGSVVLFAAYTASLTSQLALVNFEDPFESLEEAITTAGYSVLIKKGSGFILNAKAMRTKSETFDKLYKQWESQPELLVPSDDAGLDMIQSTKGKYAYFRYDQTVNPRTKNNCSFAYIGRKLFPDHAYFPTAKNLSYARVLSYHITKIKDGGILGRLQVKWFGRKNQCEPPPFQRFGFTKTLSAFVILGIGMILAVSICFVEVLVHKGIPRRTQEVFGLIAKPDVRIHSRGRELN